MPIKLNNYDVEQIWEYYSLLLQEKYAKLLVKLRDQPGYQPVTPYNKYFLDILQQRIKAIDETFAELYQSDLYSLQHDVIVGNFSANELLRQYQQAPVMREIVDLLKGFDHDQARRLKRMGLG